VDAVSPTPVVAAGGVADGRGLAAVLALGASGAWIGTRFLASHEATTHRRYRERLLRANENDTVFLENLFGIHWPNAPHRVLRTQTVKAWEVAGRSPSGKPPGEGEVIATSRSNRPIVRYQSFTPSAGAEGDIDALSLWAGQSGGPRVQTSKLQSAGDIVHEIADEARLIPSAFGSMTASGQSRPKRMLPVSVQVRNGLKADSWGETVKRHSLAHRRPKPVRRNAISPANTDAVSPANTDKVKPSARSRSPVRCTLNGGAAVIGEVFTAILIRR
jgi:hypothetical protein